MSTQGFRPHSVCGLTDNIHVAAVSLSDQCVTARMHLPLHGGRAGCNPDSSLWHPEILGLQSHAHGSASNRMAGTAFMCSE